MSPLPTITFPGLPEPEPGPIPAAAAELLRARDFGEVAFPDAPRDRTMLPELIGTADRIRAATTGIEVVFGDGSAAESVFALLAATGVTTQGGESPAYLFIGKGRDRMDPRLMEDWSRVRDRLARVDGAGWRDRVAVVTDPSQGPLFEEAVRTGVPLFAWPVWGHGLESVLSAVGLLPAACLGVDVARLLDDAREAQDRADTAPFEDSPAQRLAAALAAADGRAEPVAGSERFAPLAEWLGSLLEHLSLDEPTDDGIPIHIEPEGEVTSGIVVTGGTAGALVQTLLNGAALFGISRRGVDKRVRA